MAKVSVLGRRADTAVFRALGVDTVSVETAQEAETTFETLLRGDYAVLYVTEEWFTLLRERIAALADRALPAVLLLPGGRTGGGSVAAQALEEAVKRAVGADIA